MKKEALEDSTVETQNELKGKVAELLGYEHDPMHGPLSLQWKHHDTGKRRSHEWFDRFFCDLNACHEFEKTLSGTDWDEKGLSSWMKYYAALCAECDMRPTMMIVATAEQRCRAFVATMEGRSVVSGNEEQGAAPGKQRVSEEQG